MESLLSDCFLYASMLVNKNLALMFTLMESKEQGQTRNWSLNLVFFFWKFKLFFWSESNTSHHISLSMQTNSNKRSKHYDFKLGHFILKVSNCNIIVKHARNLFISDLIKMAACFSTMPSLVCCSWIIFTFFSLLLLNYF